MEKMNTDHDCNTPDVGVDDTVAEKRYAIKSDYEIEDESGESVVASSAVLHELRDRWNALHAQNDQLFVGMVVFGSSVKGSFNQESDIDIMIFVDPGAQTEIDVATIRTEVWPGITMLHNGNISGHPISIQGDGDQSVYIPINEEIIIEHIDDVVQIRTETRDDEGMLEDYFVARKALFAPFLMRVGDGKINQYRQTILNQIVQAPDPDLLWQAIARRVLDYEETHRGADIYLPATLEEAKKYYNVPTAS